MVNITNPIFFYRDQNTGNYTKILNPEFYKYTRNGERIPYTAQDLENNSIQPYDKLNNELIIKPIKSHPGHYVVSMVSLNMNINNNENNSVSITNIVQNNVGNIEEKLSGLKKKYRQPGSGPALQTISYISNKDLVTNDLLFLYNYYQQLLAFYKQKITNVKGANVANNSIKREISFMNVFKNYPKGAFEFYGFFSPYSTQFKEVSERYPVLELSSASSNPAMLYRKIRELHQDLEKYVSLVTNYQTKSKTMFNLINARLKTKKRARSPNNFNSNNSYHTPKKFMLGAPPRGGRVKTYRKRRT